MGAQIVMSPDAGTQSATGRTHGKNAAMLPAHEPPDPEALSESDQHREVYAWAGLALFMAQVIEHGLVNVLFLARVSDPDFLREYASADDFYETHFTQVMGRLVSAIRTHVNAPGDLEPMLEEALRLRNLVVHRFFRERIELFCEQQGRSQMLAELGEIVTQMRGLDRRLDELTLSLGAHYGITADTIASMVDEMRQGAAGSGTP